jgi:predicted amidophosphoribosyltransferase
MLFVEAFAGLLLLGTGRHLYREFRRVRRDNKGLCTQCGYDLRGGRERCPECGMPIPGPSDRAATQPGSTPEPR